MVGEVDIQCPIDIDGLPDEAWILFDEEEGLCDIWPSKLNLTLCRISKLAAISDIPSLAQAFLSKAQPCPPVPYILRGDRFRMVELVSGGKPHHVVPVEIPEPGFSRLKRYLDQLCDALRAAVPHISVKAFDLKDMNVCVRKTSKPWKKENWPEGAQEGAAQVKMHVRELRMIHLAEKFHMNDPRWLSKESLPPMMVQVPTEETGEAEGEEGEEAGGGQPIFGTWGSDPYGSGVTGIPACYILESFDNKKARLEFSAA